MSLNFHENGDFNNFTKYLHVGNIKGVAWQYFSILKIIASRNIMIDAELLFRTTI